MKRLIEAKVLVIFLAVAGLLALVLLPVALRDLTFNPPEPFSLDMNGVFAPLIPTSGFEIAVWKYFLFGGLLLLILAIILFIMDPELRKRILIRLLRLGFSLATLWFIISYIFDRNSLRALLKPASVAGGEGSSINSAVDNIAYIPPHINPWLVFFVSFIVSVMLVIFAWFLYSRRSKSGEKQVIDKVAAIARDALEELGPGRSWDDAIVRAYIRMNEAVFDERGLVRQPANTPSEFALCMIRMGLPGEAVVVLTHLFESVRYGGEIPSQSERDQAAAALNTILHSIGCNS